MLVRCDTLRHECTEWELRLVHVVSQLTLDKHVKVATYQSATDQKRAAAEAFVVTSGEQTIIKSWEWSGLR